MSHFEPFRPGEIITIEHLSGSRKEVTFLEITGNKLSMAYIQWGSSLGGKYRVDMNTGKLMPKKASVWHLSKNDLARLKATMFHERRLAKEKIKERRRG